MVWILSQWLQLFSLYSIFLGFAAKNGVLLRPLPRVEMHTSFVYFFHPQRCDIVVLHWDYFVICIGNDFLRWHVQALKTASCGVISVWTKYHYDTPLWFMALSFCSPVLCFLPLDFSSQWILLPFISFLLHCWVYFEVQTSCHVASFNYFVDPLGALDFLGVVNRESSYHLDPAGSHFGNGCVPDALFSSSLRCAQEAQ